MAPLSTTIATARNRPRCTARQPLCADIDGFILHPAVRVETHDRKRLEQLCRYITQPALSDEQVLLNATGHVELKRMTLWRDGTTHLVMSPLVVPQAQPVQAQATSEAAAAAPEASARGGARLSEQDGFLDEFEIARRRLVGWHRVGFQRAVVDMADEVVPRANGRVQSA